MKYMASSVNEQDAVMLWLASREGKMAPLGITRFIPQKK